MTHASLQDEPAGIMSIAPNIEFEEKHKTLESYFSF